MQSTSSTAESRERGPGARATTVLASCADCERLHPAAPLEFDPVCRFCAGERATMQCLGMKGSFPLRSATIAAELERASPGNYALGCLEEGRFVVFYVGRSDSNLKRRLESWIDVPSRSDPFAPSGMAAWGSRRRAATPLASPSSGRAGRATQSSYTHFAYSYAPSAEAALAKECRNYDDFGGCAVLDNERSPYEPDASTGRPAASVE